MKERSVAFAPEALEDLRNLYDWIAAAASTATALAYIERIEAFCRTLSHAAERGHRRDDIRAGLRIVGFERRVSIAFTVAEASTVILRVFYGGRDWETALQ